MQQLGMGQAVHQALREEMARDDRVFVAGEGVGVSIHDSPMLPTAGLLKDFGPRRVKDTPVSEAAIAGLAVGAAVAGLRPSEFPPGHPPRTSMEGRQRLRPAPRQPLRSDRCPACACAREGYWD
ncbi:MAG: hypothetical protein MUF52_13185 [Syntrophobacteraceae bacterium]|jgi:hypothetical protein|nr:hypothetical protein [Syntrophobacteraceae bacterium]